MNIPTSMDMIIIIKSRMMSEKFLACDFKLQPFYLHNAICCNINMKSIQLSNSVELLIYFCKIWFPASGLRGRNDKDLTKPVWKIKVPIWVKSIHLFFWNHTACKHKKLSRVINLPPSSTIGTFDEHLMLLGMNVTSTITFKENGMTVLQFLQAAKEKQYRHACEKLNPVLKMWKFQETWSVLSCDYHSYAQMIWKIFLWAPWFHVRFRKVLIILPHRH